MTSESLSGYPLKKSSQLKFHLDLIELVDIRLLACLGELISPYYRLFILMHARFRLPVIRYMYSKD